MSEFKYLSLEEREEIALEDFGDPERRLFPIIEQEDLDKAPQRIAALADAESIRNNILAIAKRKGFTIPEVWGVVAASFNEEPQDPTDGISNDNFILFSNTKTATSDGEYVLRTGKIFEAGKYDDKEFEINPEELCEAISDFSPVDIDLEHVPTILDGKLGKLEAVALGDDGWSLIGTVRLPKWLDDQLEEGDRKVSATWDRANKRLKKLALVRNPRVKDAALMAAFTLNELKDEEHAVSEKLVNSLTNLFESIEFGKRTWDGRSLMQSMHDMAARAGAVCREDNASDFVAADELKAIQQMHDASVKAGAKCNFINEKTETRAYYSSDKNKEKEEMTIKDIKEWFNKLPDDASIEDIANDKSGDSEPQFSQPSDREVALEEELKRLREEKIRAEAEKFADAEIKENRAYPTERESIIALFTQLSIDDYSSEAEISFGEGDNKTTGNRLDVLKSIYSVRKPHNFTKEEVEEQFDSVLLADKGDRDDYIAEAAAQASAFAKRKNKEKGE